MIDFKPDSGQDWSKYFIETIKKNPDIIIDEALMTGWFANAIELSNDYRSNYLYHEEIISKLKIGKHNIVFRKVNGDLRKMCCTLDPFELKSFIDDYVKDESETTVKSNIIVYDLDKTAWRSFKIDSLISITKI